ncbi:MAG: trypsin-like peptidase domain-containing protein [Caulobacter sp.]|nr:trypsin-like peptidase domain-containing protein [Vitreoscilla sp.]
MPLNRLLRRRCARLSILLLALAGAPWAHATSPVAHPAAPASPLAKPAAAAASSAAAQADNDADDSSNLSASARRLYDFGRPRLLQVRTLLRDQDSQASVGSGSLVGADGLILTNYHVVSQVALEPQRYRLNYQTVDGAKGALQLIAFDVVHDLALVRMATPPPTLAARGTFEFRPAATPLSQGERIFSLGNPLDVGFAVVEGTYNGMVERSFLPQILFSGSLNPGMSGGPVLDDRGHIVGVNVATRRDGQQISFLVPGEFAQALIARGAHAKPITTSVEAEMARQLLAHQQELTSRFVALPWRETKHAHYSVPVPQEDFMRCWGSSNPSESKGLSFERSDCQMDTAIFINESLRTGDLAVRHEVYDGSKLGALRFAEEAGQSFRNEGMGRRTHDLTAPKCQEDFVENAGLPMRTVMCLRAYRHLPGLYDVAVLSQSVDAKTEGVQGRFDARGVSFENAMLLATHYLKGFAWKRSP